MQEKDLGIVLLFPGEGITDGAILGLGTSLLDYLRMITKNTCNVMNHMSTNFE